MKVPICVIIAATVLLCADTIPRTTPADYVLGPEDAISVRVVDLDEFTNVQTSIQSNGNVRLPLIGDVGVGGLTMADAEKVIATRLSKYLQNSPSVMLQVAEYRAQPVSVLGAVNTPGVIQVRGRRNLMEVLSQAGGLRPDAGNSIVITRPKLNGTLPLRAAREDASGQFQIAELRVNALLEAQDPADNIMVKAGDVLSVPKAPLVYVVGSVRRSGGFVLTERDHLSVLQALSMAEGLELTASPRKARILRQQIGKERHEIPIDLTQVLAGKAPDAELYADDILFVPSSAMKTTGSKIIERMIQIGTGIAIYGR
jgi:polysaccharide biosynthesis/export protein